MTKPPVIAIDGPSGSGKGTIASELASKLDFNYLDSGAIYRTLGIAVQKANVDFMNHAQIVEIYNKSDISFESGKPHSVILNGKDVGMLIRSQMGSDFASKLGQIPEIRDILLEGQRAYRREPGLVADGRDMGTTVFPDASLKIFLTASVKERAKRRYKQLITKGIDATLPDLLQDLKERDKRDIERTVSPLKPAEDAVTLDSTDLTIDEVVNQILKLFLK
ncbi:MAG: (d)CMP kinase [Pseudohongiellaceae bacterium]